MNRFPCCLFFWGNTTTGLIIFFYVCLHTCCSPQAYFRMPSESSSRAPKDAFLPSARAGRKFTACPGHLQGRHALAVLKPCGVTQTLLHLNMCFLSLIFLLLTPTRFFARKPPGCMCWSGIFACVLTTRSRGRKMSRGMNEGIKVYVC